MATGGSVTHWLGELLHCNADGAQKLWERYFQQLVVLARRKLHRARPRAADEEDVALSAFDSFCRGVEAGRFPRLADREDLWRLLVVMTARKAFHLLRDESRHKRGGKAGAPTVARAVQTEEAALERVLGREPSPAFAAQVAEECLRLLAKLEDAELCSVALWKMEGYSNDEIAVRLDCAPRTVERKLRLIRGLWEKELAP
jgi:DNA-directed RNA polymerase specialized sigma24 family protein